MSEQHIIAATCPTCQTKLRTKDSRACQTYGFETVRRRKVCDTCGFREHTVEIPVALADDIFEEDA